MYVKLPPEHSHINHVVGEVQCPGVDYHCKHSSSTFGQSESSACVRPKTFWTPPAAAHVDCAVVHVCCSRVHFVFTTRHYMFLVMMPWSAAVC